MSSNYGSHVGGSLETHVLAHLYQAQFKFAYHKGEYSLVLSTEIAQRVRGSLLLTSTGKTAHYDVLEEAEALMTEPEDNSEREVEPTTLPGRNVCGVCGERHTQEPQFNVNAGCLYI